MGSVQEWRSGRRKEIVLPSGKKATIRKLRQRDFIPDGLIALALDMDEKEITSFSENHLKQYLRDHPEEIMSTEERILLRGMVDPQVTNDVTDDTKLFVGDIDDDERTALVLAIIELSEFTTSQIAEVDKFRGKDVDHPDPHGQVLPRPATPTVGLGDS